MSYWLLRSYGNLPHSLLTSPAECRTLHLLIGGCFMPQSALRVSSRQERLEARVTSDQKRLIERAARLRGTSVTDFMVAELQEAAVQTIKEFETLQLLDEARDRFVQTLLNPPEPNEAARAAAARYKKQIGL